MKYSRVGILSAGFLAVLVLLASGCHKKDAEAARKEKVIREQFKITGVSFYPGSETLEQAANVQWVRKPGSEKAGEGNEIAVTNVWQATKDGVDKIRAFYEKKAPHILNEEKEDGETTFLQMCSTENVGKVIAEGKQSVILVDIRKNTLTEAERAALENELAALKKSPNPDLVQKRRMKDLNRQLSGKTLVQTKLRTIRPKAAPEPKKS